MVPKLTAYFAARMWYWFVVFERFLVRHSLVGDKEFFDSRAFPWVGELERNWKVIRAELDAVLKRQEDLPDFRVVSPGLRPLAKPNDWRMFVFHGYGMRSERNCSMCPETAKALDKIPGMKTAFFSILKPGTHIAPHRGLYAGVLRCHLALEVPEEREKCFIVVGSKSSPWKEGECLVFDDTHVHEVHNRTDQRRVILFIDFKRPLPPVLDWINETFIFFMSKNKLLRDSRRNQLAWEDFFHGDA